MGSASLVLMGITISVFCWLMFWRGYFNDGLVAFSLDTGESTSRFSHFPAQIKAFITMVFPGLGITSLVFPISFWLADIIPVRSLKIVFFSIAVGSIFCFLLLCILPIKYPDRMYPRKRHEWMRQKRFEEWNRGSVFRPSYETYSWIGKGKLEVVHPVVFKNNPENEYDLYPRIDLSL